MNLLFKYRFILPTIIASFTLLYWLFLALSISDIHDFIYVGKFFIQKSNASSIISAELKNSQRGFGYDGQFFYYIALDPMLAHNYIDDPPYRFARIVYPVLARVLSFGNLKFIAYNLLIINIVSILGTVYLLSKYLMRFNISPYYSLIYAFYPGVYVSLGHDLNEPIAYFLTMAGIYFFEPKNIVRFIASLIFFILAIFTREATAIFSLIYGASLMFKISDINKQIRINQNFKKGLIFCLLLILPYSLYLFFLNTHFSPDISPHLSLLPPVLFYFWPWGNHITLVLLPSFMLFFITFQFLKKGIMTSSIAALSAHILLLVILIPDDYSMYANIGRYANGLVFAAVLSLPALVNFNRKLITLIVGAAILWFQAWIVDPQFIGGSQIGIYIYFASMLTFIGYFFNLNKS